MVKYLINHLLYMTAQFMIIGLHEIVTCEAPAELQSSNTCNAAGRHQAQGMETFSPFSSKFCCICVNPRFTQYEYCEALSMVCVSAMIFYVTENFLLFGDLADICSLSVRLVLALFQKRMIYLILLSIYSWTKKHASKP